MIVKIWPIKADYGGERGKVGGLEGLENSVKYIMDKEKIIATEEEEKAYKGFDESDVLEGSRINRDFDINRVVSYMANKDKTEIKYASTYLCPESNPAIDFRNSANLLAVKSGFKIDPDTGAMAFHLVQSFPEHLNISDEEVHQCGMDLVQRLGKYQALICSHVHPVLDEKNEVHGKCKHNHILLNAYMHPDFYDYTAPDVGKYNDCVESYRQLQIYNDEIAIEHGLPIIRQADMQRTYSWTESTAINKGTSWKERVRVDVETCRRVAENWEEFIQIMSDQGYKISEKKHTTYTSPDNHVVRAGTLGSPYTRESLEMYWAIRDNVKERFKEDFNSNYEPVLSDFVTHYDGNLSVKIPLGPQYLEHRQFAFMPLNKDTKANEEALRSYMRMDELYDICDENGVPVMAASGIEILRSIEDLRDEERMRYREYMRMEEEEMREDRRRREAAKEEEEEKNKQYYSQKKFRSSRSGMRYRCSLYDENGRRRSIIELILLLAIVVLTKEAHVWVHREGVPKEQANEIFFATPNDKMQLIVDSVDLARQEAIDTPAQLDKRLDIVGAEYSRTKKAYNNTSRAAARMEPLANAINTYKKTKKIAEGIDALPEGDEKNEMIAKYKDVIEEYKAAKHVMYVNKVVSEEAIIDFDLRYYKITQDAKELEARLKDNAEHYKRLKKLEYSLQLAEDPNFIYGPSYPGVGFKFKDDEEAKTYKPLWHKLEEEKEKAKESAPEPGENAAREDEKEAEKV